MEYIADLITRCAVYENLYRDDASVSQTTLRCLEKELLGLYTRILVFLAKSKGYYTHNTAGEFRYGIPRTPLHEY